MRSFIFLSVVFIYTFFQKVCGQDLQAKSPFEKEFEQTCRLVVMLKVDYGGGTPEFGGGIVFGHDANHLFVATAYHVVHKGRDPLNILVSVKNMADKKVIATLLKSGSAPDLDLAILSIDDPVKQGVNPCAFPYEKLKVDNLRFGDSVFLIGNPQGNSWAKPTQADKVSQVNEKEIVFQSSFISGGHSGGALVDKKGSLVGMTIADAPPLGRAINIDRVIRQIKQRGYPLQLTNFYYRDEGVPAVHFAAMNGDLEQMKKLIAGCADPDEVDIHSITALHLAAYWGKVEAMKLLLQAGANIEASDAIGDTPLHHAVSSDTNNLESVKFLIKAGADINIQNNQGLTPLCESLNTDSIICETPLFLINSGADINLPDFENQSPLHYAITNGADKVVEALIKAGANVNVEDNKQETPLTLSVSDNKLVILKLLISSGANVNANGPLEIAALQPENIEIIKTLLAAGAKVNAVDEDGNTPLHIAIGSATKYQPPTESELIVAVTTLLKAGANPNIKNAAGNSPLSLAKIILADSSSGTDGNANSLKAIEKLLSQYGGK
jgi:ankyrin repeat protein